jgi:excisionase family DNA binding protein
MPEIEKFRFTRREAAHSLGLSIRSVDYLVSSGRLPHVKNGGRILILRDVLRRYALSHHPEPIRPCKTAISDEIAA